MSNETNYFNQLSIIYVHTRLDFIMKHRNIETTSKILLLDIKCNAVVNAHATSFYCDKTAIFRNPSQLLSFSPLTLQRRCLTAFKLYYDLAYNYDI